MNEDSRPHPLKVGIVPEDRFQEPPSEEDFEKQEGRPLNQAVDSALKIDRNGRRSAFRAGDELLDRWLEVQGFAKSERMALAVKFKQLAARAKTKRTTKHVPAMRDLPPLPKGLNWPTERFEESPEAGKWTGIVAYLERVWLPLIDRKLIDRPTLTYVDPSAGKALENYLYNGGKHRSLPEKLDIPKKSEVHDRLFADNLGDAVRSSPKLAAVIAMRHRRGTAIPT